MEQDPPAELDSIHKVVRFVSLIPFTQDYLSFGAKDVWSDSQEFLDTLTGDYEEHAILLCNYFKHLKMDAYVAIGWGVPEGQTCYVITMQTVTNAKKVQEQQITIWNAAMGQFYDSKDSKIPLQSISVIFNDENVSNCNIVITVCSDTYSLGSLLKIIIDLGKFATT